CAEPGGGLHFAGACGARHGQGRERGRARGVAQPSRLGRPGRRVLHPAQGKDEGRSPRRVQGLRGKGDPMAAVTRAELLEVVYRFYARGLLVYALGWADTEERQRQLAAAQRGVTEAETWKAMLRRLEARYGPLTDQSVLLLSGHYDPAWSADIYIPGRS